MSEREGVAMRLPEFILGELEAILVEWEKFARTIVPATQGMSAERLRDHAREMLISISHDMQTAQSPAEQLDKSRGLRKRKRPHEDSASETHAVDRLGEGFTLNELVSEYRALRASVIRLWTAKMGQADQSNLDELTRFNEAIDEALTESIARYTERVERARDLMLGALGHDLRSPLGVVIQSARYLLRTEELGGTHTKAVARIFSSGTRMKGMISDLLDFARTRLGDELPITPVPMDMRAACRAAVDEMAALHPDHHIQCQLQGALTGAWDPGRIGQLLSNLIGNAIEHGSSDTPILVSASTEDTHVRIEVHNEGTPIPYERRRKLFEPLTRGGPEESKGSNGNQSVGLGLYIACQIAKAHGGALNLVSSDERGTAFAVQLPRDLSPAHPTAATWTPT